MRLQSGKWAKNMNGQFTELQRVDNHIVFLLLLIRLKMAMIIFYLSDLQIFLKVTKCNIDQDTGHKYIPALVWEHT